MADPLQVVLDTNVLIAAFRSRRGASYRLLSLVGVTDLLAVNLSVPLVFECESVLKRTDQRLFLSSEHADAVVDYLCSVAREHSIFYLWRPILRDPKDDMVLELAVNAQCSHIVTFNKRDFAEARQFGITLVTPREFLIEIGDTL